MAPLLIDGGSLFKRFIIAAAAIVAIASTSIADAKPRHAHKRLTQAQVTCDQRGCSDNPAAQGGQARASRANADAMPTQTADANGNVVGGRPSGCPHRFCGCSASLYVFGEIRPELNLAANWTRKFPRTEPASGMVAARRGHVMVLMSHASGDEWLVHDGNSGGGRTREHVRSIRGYTIVNPRATVTAQN
jgi:hypothetical protein